MQPSPMVVLEKYTRGVGDPRRFRSRAGRRGCGRGVNRAKPWRRIKASQARPRRGGGLSSGRGAPVCVAAPNSPAAHRSAGFALATAIAESLAVPVTFDMISQQKRDETKPTRPLTASESNFWSRWCVTPLRELTRGGVRGGFAIRRAARGCRPRAYFRAKPASRV